MGQNIKKTNIQRIRVRLCFLFIICFFLVPQKMTASQQEAAKTVKVGYVNLPGYQEGTGEEYKTGAGYEYLQRISYYTDWNYEYVYGTSAQLQKMLAKGEIDLMGNMFSTEENQKRYDFSSFPQGKARFFMYAKEERSDLESGEVDALQGADIGVVLNSYEEELTTQWIDCYEAKASVCKYESESELIDALLQGDVDTVVMTEMQKVSGIMPVIYMGYEDFYFAVSKGKTDLLAQLDEAMIEIQSANPHYNEEVAARYSKGNVGDVYLTEGEKDFLAKNDNTLRIGYVNHNLPYCSLSKEGRLIGLLSTLIDTLQEHFDIKVVTSCYDDKDLVHEALKRGEIDAMAPVYDDFWLAEQYGFALTNSFSMTTPVILYQSDDSKNVTDVIAVSEENLVCAHVVGILLPEAKQVPCQTLEECMELLSKGEVSSVVVPASSLNILKQYRSMDNIHTAEMVQQMNICLGTKKDTPMVTSIINRAISLSNDSLYGVALTENSYVQKHYTLMDYFRDNVVVVMITLILLSVLIFGMMYRLVWRAKNAETQAKLALEQAKAANSAKSDFLSRMSHDIRTPLNGIIGIIEINEKNDTDIELLRENRKKAKVAAKHLLALVNDVLEMSKLEANQMELVDEPFDLKELFDDIYVLAGLRASEYGVTLSYDEGVNLKYPEVYGSPLHVRRILLNILNNAVKYNKPGGSISFTSRVEHETEDMVTYRLKVKDTGIGMSEEFLERICEPFTQERSDARSTYQGTGMGMAIVKALVEKMNGTMEIYSRLKEGTTFEICLPFRINHNPTFEKPSVEEVCVDGMRILLVEDNELNMEIAKCLLEESGLVVSCASNGQEAVDLFEEKAVGSFDAILMDIMMPVLDGYQATKKIRLSEKEDAKTIPIIAMTANAFAEDERKARQVGMNAHLSKPIDLDKLLHTLGKYKR